MKRSHNFSAGPSKLPDEVLARLAEELPDFCGQGFSAIEISHRSPRFFKIYEAALDGIRSLMKLPENYRVLFLHGGASLQFAMIPYNFLKNGKKGAYLDTGVWSKKAYVQAGKIGKIDILLSGEASGYQRLPDYSNLNPSSLDYAYLHLTSNNTIYGTQYPDFPDTQVPLLCDASSDIFSRAFPIEKFGLVYGGAQKNLAVSGMGFAVIREDLLVEAGPDDLDLLMYKTYADFDSMFNTPNTFAIYVTAFYCDWLSGIGGVEAIAVENGKKAELLYELIDTTDFYQNGVHPPHRSKANVVFNIENRDLEPEFLREAEQAGLHFLKGHKAVGGLRASLYNSVRLASVEALVDFMKHFERKKG